jgi:hypothetical protein
MSTHVGLKQGHCFFSRYADSKNIFFFSEAINSERGFLLAIPSSNFGPYFNIICKIDYFVSFEDI